MEACRASWVRLWRAHGPARCDRLAMTGSPCAVAAVQVKHFDSSAAKEAKLVLTLQSNISSTAQTAAGSQAGKPQK